MRKDKTLAFYRSSAFRYVQIITGITVIVSLLWPGHDNWRNTPSLKLVHMNVPAVAWTWALIFTVYVTLLIIHTPLTAEVADWLGLCVGICFSGALLVSAARGHPTNWIALAFLIDGVAAHYAAARLAHFDRHGVE